MYCRKTSVSLFVANIMFWMGIFVYYSFFKYAGHEQYAILKIFLFIEPVLFFAGLLGYLRKNRLIFIVTMIFLVVNSILSITDEVGIFDVISLLLNVVLLVILVLQWKNILYKSKRGGKIMSDNLGCFGIIMKFFGQIQDVSYPYRTRDDFLSEAERSFYHVLKSAVGNTFAICSKVSLKEFVFTNCSDKKSRTVYQNKINLKHVDFLLCEPASMKPVMAIELDDSSHKREDRIKRDYFMNKLFETIGLPLVRFETKKFYKLAEVVEKISVMPQLDQQKEEASTASMLVEESPPVCPKCGIPMVKRIAQKGERAGKTFYGCSNYPKCKEVKNES